MAHKNTTKDLFDAWAIQGKDEVSQQKSDVIEFQRSLKQETPLIEILSTTISHFLQPILNILN